MTGPLVIVLLTLVAVVVVLAWVAWDHVRYSAAASEPVRFVRSHRRGWFS